MSSFEAKQKANRVLMSNITTMAMMGNHNMVEAAKMGTTAITHYSPNSPSKSIRIDFHHNGSIAIVPFVGTRKQDIKDFLSAVWSQFGKIEATYYNHDFSHCFVTYQSWNTVFAMMGMSDPMQLQVAIQTAVGADYERAVFAKQIFVAGLDGNVVSLSYADGERH